jgi:2-oxoglutarate dehydrogenase complex dehydrogenase (E1) component-like enzyme
MVGSRSTSGGCTRIDVEERTSPDVSRGSDPRCVSSLGYLETDLDPLGRLRPMQLSELAVQAPEAEEGRSIYCRTISVEFMHIPDLDRREWIARQIEAPPPRA